MKKTEKHQFIKEIFQSHGKNLVPFEKLPKPPTDEKGWKDFCKTAFDPKNFNTPELDNMDAQELRNKLAEIRETRKRIGLPPFVSMDATLDELWKKKHKK
jgi:hypothetical protein